MQHNSSRNLASTWLSFLCVFSCCCLQQDFELLREALESRLRSLTGSIALQEQLIQSLQAAEREARELSSACLVGGCGGGHVDILSGYIVRPEQRLHGGWVGGLWGR
jgi:hypothetical protein